MEIIFATSSCSKNTYEKVFNLRHKKTIDPAQRFFEQLIYGASCLDRCSVISISAKPVSASTCKKRFFRKEKEVSGRVRYIYPGFFNGKFLRLLTTFITTFFSALFLLKKKKEQIVLCDPLCYYVAKPVRLAAKIKGIKSIAIVTDVPTYATKMKSYKHSKIRTFFQNAFERKSLKETKKYDGYVFLTEYMNECLNSKNKPYTIVEGSVDVRVAEDNERVQKEKVVMYCGGIYEKYGVKRLVDAFASCNAYDYKLFLYGDGTYVEELKNICSKNTNVCYKGCVLNQELLSIEKRAMLLVNPRLVNEEYTKFSFPSKTMEYLSSGTSVVSTKLCGIPKDYGEYLFWFDSDSVTDMSQKLTEILSKTEDELIRFGNRGREFVLKNKNNVLQAKRILQLCEVVLNRNDE